MARFDLADFEWSIIDPERKLFRPGRIHAHDPLPGNAL
jgi:hypothetical protein